MNISKMLKPTAIRLGATATSREDAIDELIALLATSENIDDAQACKTAIVEREDAFSTYVGDGIALPHAQTDALDKPRMAAVVFEDGLAWGSEEELCNIAFLVVAPSDAGQDYPDMLSQLTSLLAQVDVNESLQCAFEPEEFLQVLADAEGPDESSHEAPEEPQTEPEEEPHAGAEADLHPDSPKADAPIAKHRQEEEAPKPAATHDVDDPIEPTTVPATTEASPQQDATSAVKTTGGKQGARHLADESDTLAGLAKQRKIAMGHLDAGARHLVPLAIVGGLFATLGMQLDPDGAGAFAFGSTSPTATFFTMIAEVAFDLMLPVLAGLIAHSIADKKALAPGFIGGMLARTGIGIAYVAGAPDFNPSLNVSGGFIVAVLAGLAAGYLTLGFEYLLAKLPRNQLVADIADTYLLPALASLGTALAIMLLNPAFNGISTGIYNYFMSLEGANLTMFCAVVAGMAAVDLGGAFSTAALTVAVTLVADSTESGPVVMASVLVARAIPTLIGALSSTVLSREKWSRELRWYGVVSYLFGIAGIPESAIPFATADPLHTLPTFAASSALAGAIVAASSCEATAPTGGFFGLAATQNSGQIVFAVIVGSIIGALMLSFAKLPPKERTPKEWVADLKNRGASFTKGAKTLGGAIQARFAK